MLLSSLDYSSSKLNHKNGIWIMTETRQPVKIVQFNIEWFSKNGIILILKVQSNNFLMSAQRQTTYDFSHKEIIHKYSHERRGKGSCHEKEYLCRHRRALQIKKNPDWKEGCCLCNGGGQRPFFSPDFPQSVTPYNVLQQSSFSWHTAVGGWCLCEKVQICMSSFLNSPLKFLYSLERQV